MARSEHGRVDPEIVPYQNRRVRDDGSGAQATASKRRSQEEVSIVGSTVKVRRFTTAMPAPRRASLPDAFLRPDAGPSTRPSTRPGGAPISKYVYGQFLEHIGGTRQQRRLGRDARRPEVLLPDHVTAARRAAGRRRSARAGPRRWTPIGADDFVTHGRQRRPTSATTRPRSQLGASEAHGIEQAGLAVRKGTAYTGRIVLAGTPGAIVNVSLVWGPAPTDRQTVVVTSSAPPTKVPLSFTAGADATMPASRSSGPARAPSTSAPSR